MICILQALHLITHGWSEYVIYLKNEIFLFADCRLQVDGEVRTSIKITSTSTTTITVWGSSNCTIRILAVGGGGGE